LAAVELARGNPERAVGACREALRVTESSDSTDDVGMPMCRIEALLGLAAAYLRLGDHDYLRSAFAALADTGYRCLEARARSVLAELHLAGATPTSRSGKACTRWRCTSRSATPPARPTSMSPSATPGNAPVPPTGPATIGGGHTPLLADAGSAQAVDVAALLATEPAPSS
jgi:hypothetical protein